MDFHKIMLNRHKIFTFLILSVISLIFLGACGSDNNTDGQIRGKASIIERGVINCFADGLTTSKGKPVYCETSAIAYQGTYLIFGSDKPIPKKGHSAVFAIKYTDNGLPTDSGLSIEPLSYLTAPSFLAAIKYEDFTVTPDGLYVIATTGFDRVKSGSVKWDGYNTLLLWKVGSPDTVTVASPTTTNGVTSSVSLREKISLALKSEQFPNGVPYFKVEGLAAIPGNKLLFGIRELGANYKEFEYAAKIISVSYQIRNGNVLVLADDFKLIYSYDVSKAFNQQTVALSSLEYDKHSDRLYLLTCFEESETDEGLGGYLWTLPIADLKSGKAPTFEIKEDGTPLLFAHKSEGITVLSKNKVLVIHDDDRVLGRKIVENPETQFSRQANQAAYSIVFWTRNPKH